MIGSSTNHINHVNPGEWFSLISQSICIVFNELLETIFSSDAVNAYTDKFFKAYV